MEAPKGPRTITYWALKGGTYIMGFRECFGGVQSPLQSEEVVLSEIRFLRGVQLCIRIGGMRRLNLEFLYGACRTLPLLSIDSRDAEEIGVCRLWLEGLSARGTVAQGSMFESRLSGAQV